MDSSKLQIALRGLKWEEGYRERSRNPGMFLAPLEELDPDFKKYMDLPGTKAATVLDIGTGGGEQAIYLAQMGHKVTATDVSATAIQAARDAAARHHVNVRFVEDNILISQLAGTFDLITDRGCYAAIIPAHKMMYVDSVKRLLRPGGWLFLKTDRKREADLTPLMSDDAFHVYAQEYSAYTSLKGKKVPARLIVLQRKDQGSGK